MSALPVDQLLAPLEDMAPCGADLEYDAAFLALNDAAQGKPEQQFGDTLIAAQPPDWREVHAQALALAQRTRDLRIAVLLARSGARLHGLGHYAGALALIAGLLEQQWAGVYPQLEADAAAIGGQDATMRLNALAPLAFDSAGLADLRAASLAGDRAALTVRHVELSFGKAAARAEEAVPTPDAVLKALQAAAAGNAQLPGLLRQPLGELRRIENVVAERCGAAQGPELRDLRRVLEALAGCADAVQGVANPAEGGAAAGTAVAMPTIAGGAFNSRSDVLRSLDSACDWIEQHEPSNPAPLLIRRAQRLMNKNFIDIIRDLVPDGIDQVEKIAGSATQA
jgi:type VI secretion system protein ImpA